MNRLHMLSLAANEGSIAGSVLALRMRFDRTVVETIKATVPGRDRGYQPETKTWFLRGEMTGLLVCGCCGGAMDAGGFVGHLGERYRGVCASDSCGRWRDWEEARALRVTLDPRPWAAAATGEAGEAAAIALARFIALRQRPKARQPVATGPQRPRRPFARELDIDPDPDDGGEEPF